VEVNKERLLELVPRLARRRVMVVGDLFLDEYIVGRAVRLSREAPVPVLEFSREFHLPGGGANPAYNIQALGGIAEQVGIVGDDQAGRALVKSLEEAGIATQGVVVDGSRPTTTKTRVVAEGTLVFPQQLVRIDRLSREPLSPHLETRLISYLEENVPQQDAVLISDYRSGVVSQDLAQATLKLGRCLSKVMAVDSQGDLEKYRGYGVIKCNRGEAEQAAGFPLQEEADFQRAGREFLERLETSAILITRAGEGMSVMERSGAYAHIPAPNRTEVFDVTGAGDTLIAVVTLALAAGASLLEACHLSQYAAGLVVRKLGNATVTREELAWAIRNW